MKECKTCHVAKQVTDFYVSKRNKEGFNPECKKCTIERGKRNIEQKKINDPNYEENRRNYCRKWYQENGTAYKADPEKERQRQIIKRTMFPEKKKARAASRLIELSSPTNARHHWSYNEPHWKDIIELSVGDHMFLHRYIIYDHERLMYRRSTDNVLLDTRENHVAWWCFVRDNFER